MNPPIRAERDVAAIKRGIQDGTVDIIATDHAPHHFDDKNKEFDAAAFGISGLETAFSLGLHLVDEGIIDLKRLITMMTITPSNIIKLNKGKLVENGDADITIIDLEKKVVIDGSAFRSKGKNTPFHGWHVRGSVEKTIVNGKAVDWT